MKELNKEEFQKTFGENMAPIDFDKTLLSSNPPIAGFLLLEPEGAYRNNTDTFEHHLVKTGTENVFWVYVKDLKSKGIDYHILDLNKEYGLK